MPTNHFPCLGRYTSNLARALVPLLGADEQLLLLHNPSQLSRWPLPPANGRVCHLSAPNSLAQQWQIPRLIQPLNAAVYHSPYYLMPYRVGLPTLLTVYDFIPERYPQSGQSHTKSAKAKLKRLCQQADVCC